MDGIAGQAQLKFKVYSAVFLFFKKSTTGQAKVSQRIKTVYSPLSWLKLLSTIQPQKRGVESGINRYALPSCAITDDFYEPLKGYSRTLNLKIPVSV
jgi:hypothetical protein